ncbi:MAG: 3',5'-cyclic-nucleotide phosphodiesterase [Acidobacteria bacterium]|nr:3',5'-cyclic-nucleotide phosphodiesterase [Acidobacteriota bacterium]
MKLQLLPSTIEDGKITPKQHLSCFVIDDRVAIDAGSLAMSTNEVQKKNIRDVILTHAHIDHIAGLPLFIDDLFASIVKPVDIYAIDSVIDVLKKDIFNWEVYPDFSELQNANGSVLRFCPFRPGAEFQIEHLTIKSIGVNHKVPAVGFIISDGKTTFAFSGDSSEMSEFWDAVNREPRIDALLIECAFPDELIELAEISHHLTPARLKNELVKFEHSETPIYVINIKPMYYQSVLEELAKLEIQNLEILRVGETYIWD